MKLEDYQAFDLSEFKPAGHLLEFKELLIRAQKGVKRDPKASKARVG
jgi:hypothetical protein